MKVHLQENDPSYRIFLYVFYASAFIMCSITIFGFYAMIQEWSTKGTYVMGEVLVKTEFPTPHFAKLLTWLFFTSIVSWYCVSRLGWKRTVTVSKWKLTMVQLMLLGLAIITLYETIYNFILLSSQITAGMINGVTPDIDSLTVAYPDPNRPWNLIFATKMFLAAFLISAHAFYLSTRPRKSIQELDA
ncbi:conserved membrane protein of unknown function [Nitrosotalea devaniterrae]|uniref:Uncharacterized protein n=1 Tax=Nitrosotalea devaniterrae TaxID=1078905 RepID=A0A128A671_9ARCH|nr:conserved membrane protein of unknown function [Candidatus Nitrosotalea devanaterra]